MCISGHIKYVSGYPVKTPDRGKAELSVVFVVCCKAESQVHAVVGVAVRC